MVSGAPRSTITEVDQSQYWTENSGLGVYMGIPAVAGPLQPTYIPDVDTLKKLYTLNGSIEPSDDISFQVAKRIANTTGLGLYVNRVVPDNIAYGGCVVPIGNTRAAKALSQGLANPEDITFLNGTGASAEACTITFKNDINGNTGGTAFWLPGQEYYVSFAINGQQETNSYKCLPDVNGSLSGKFIILPAGVGYVWFNTGGSTNPGNSTRSLVGLNGYEIDAANKSAAQIAAAIANLLLNPENAGLSGITITVDSAHEDTIIVTVNSFDVVQPGSAGSSGFKFERIQVGASEIPAYVASESSADYILKSVYTCTAASVTIGSTTTTLSGKYIILPEDAGYIWFSFDSGTDPHPGTLVGYEIDQSVVTASSTAEEVAAAVKNKIATIPPFNSSKYSVTLDKDGSDKYTIITLKTTKLEHTDAIGNAGTSGFIFSGAVQSAQVVVNLEYNDTAATIANKVSMQLMSSILADIFTTTFNYSSVIKVSLNAQGTAKDACPIVGSPAPVLIQTVSQGSSTAGTDAVFFYFNNPSVKANNYGIKIFNFEDYPEKAPQEGTFLVEVYTKANTKIPESSIICSRDPNAVDNYNSSIYVEDVLARLTNIRAINNTDEEHAPKDQVPQSITDILWFNGGSSGEFETGTKKLSAYINAAQPIVDKEEYAVSLLLPGGYYAAAYLQELDRIAAKRGDAVLITGVLSEREQAINYLSAIETWMNEEAVLTDSYAAVFSPAAKAYDSDTSRNITLPIETCVAEQIAFANENYSISSPILGFARGTLQNITGLTRKYKFADDGTQDGDKLYDMRVNPIRQFKDQGYVIWGQKTTQRVATARDRLNVRLMLIALKPLINQVQLGLIGELPTPATKKRAKNLLSSVFDTGVGRNWFKDNYQIEIVEDPTLEAQHILRINYTIEPWNAIEYVQGYLIITNGIVTEIS